MHCKYVIGCEMLSVQYLPVLNVISWFCATATLSASLNESLSSCLFEGYSGAA